MRTLAIVGPYGDAEGYEKISQNILNARRAAVWLAQHDIGFFCPHTHTAHFETVPDVPVEFYMELDEFFLRKCDGVLLLPGYSHSKGSIREVRLALSLGKVAFHFDEEFEHMILHWAMTGECDEEAESEIQNLSNLLGRA